MTEMLAYWIAVLAMAVVVSCAEPNLNQPTTDSARAKRAVDDCPSSMPELEFWSPGHNDSSRIVITGQRLLLASSATVYSIEIENGGVLVFADGTDITLKARYILVRNKGEIHIGSESCRHMSKAQIILYGKSTDKVEFPAHGQKFMAVESGGVLEIHGQDKLSWTLLTSHLIADGAADPTIRVADDASSWHPGDSIIVTSTDYAMEQAEEFTITSVNRTQIGLKGIAKYLHFGGDADGVNMRAEVGILTRNILIKAETEAACYGDNKCQWFPNLDTFGGHMIFHRGFKAVHMEGVEVTKMGQQVLARYPVHFHMCGNVDARGGYTQPAYVKQLSIHHSFHRCVTIHGTDGLLVQDTVSYDILGHCYFMEDGGERRNVLDHNLGALVKYSTILPTDRNGAMCQGILDDAFPGYIPPPSECNSLSVFWISHMENTIINNAAAGSERAGYWFVFHDEPSGPSKGILPVGHAKYSPLTRFDNNRAHSNNGHGVHIGFNVKITLPTAQDKRLQFSLTDGRWAPHNTSDKLMARVPAIISRYVAFKNRHGIWSRGGDIFVHDSQFGDNVVGAEMASEGIMPYDKGSHQEVVNSLFVGESINRGSPIAAALAGGRMWCKLKGFDGVDRYHDCNPWFTGYVVYDGPILIQGCSFKKFSGPLIATNRDKVAAINFFRHSNQWQMCSTNTLRNNSFDNVSRRVWTRTDQRDDSRDGDKTVILHDEDGSTTGVRGGYISRPSNSLVHHANCKQVPDWNAAVCGGRNAMVWFKAYNTQEITIVRDEFWNTSMKLSGALPGVYQPLMMLEKMYTVHWDAAAPKEVLMRMINFKVGDWIRLGLCYPPGAIPAVYYDIENVPNSRVNMNKVKELKDVDLSQGNAWFWEDNTSLLFIKIQAKHPREGWNYCSTKGCERVVVKYTGGSNSTGNCETNAYGSHKQNPLPVPLVYV